MNIFKAVTYTLVLIGALNWGLIGAFNFDLVAFIFGDMSILARIIYTIVGLAAVGYFVVTMREDTDCINCQC